MFRSEMSEVRLSGGGRVRDPKPMFQPAVEALEERVVLTIYDPAGLALSYADNLAVNVYHAAIKIANRALHTASQVVRHRSVHHLRIYRQVLQGLENTFGPTYWVRRAERYLVRMIHYLS